MCFFIFEYNLKNNPNYEFFEKIFYKRKELLNCFLRRIREMTRTYRRNQVFGRKNIQITEIAGTSMGAIIGAFLAIGTTSDEMQKITREISYLQMIDFDLKNGFIKGDKIINFLEKYFGNTQIQDLKIPLKIIATDLETGEKKVFMSGKIVDAVRASISLPGIFGPHEIDGKFFIDGGVVSNLPLEELSTYQKIGISALKTYNGPLIRKKKFLGFELENGFFGMNSQILSRAFAIMMQQNEAQSITETHGKIQVLNFEYGELDMADFDEVEKFIELGYETARKNLNIK